MIKGIVFDLDATLSDRKRVFYAIGSLLFKEHRNLFRKDLTNEQFCEKLCESDLLKNHFGWQAMGEWLNGQGVLLNKEDWKILFDFFHEKYKTIGFAEKDAYEVLDYLKEKGYKMGMITNGIKAVQWPKLEILGFDKYFEHIIICEENRKPLKKPFLDMAEMLELNPDELVYVGDNPKNDIFGARNAGYIPVWMNKYALWNFPEIKKCKYQITYLSELKDLIEKIK